MHELWAEGISVEKLSLEIKTSQLINGNFSSLKEAHERKIIEQLITWILEEEKLNFTFFRFLIKGYEGVQIDLIKSFPSFNVVQNKELVFLSVVKMSRHTSFSTYNFKIEIQQMLWLSRFFNCSWLICN